MMTREASYTREGIFGDLPVEALIAAGLPEPLSALFQAARDRISSGDASGARKILEGIASRRDIESRYCIQAWHFLRLAGGGPIRQLAKEVLGVVIEVGTTSGLDLLAVYADRTAIYSNYSGSGVIWKRPNASLDAAIAEVLEAARRVVQLIEPWTGPRRASPGAGYVRLNILTPAGLHFGEGRFDSLEQDPVARPLMKTATNLMRRLTRLPIH